MSCDRELRSKLIVQKNVGPRFLSQITRSRYTPSVYRELKKTIDPRYAQEALADIWVFYVVPRSSAPSYRELCDTLCLTMVCARGAEDFSGWYPSQNPTVQGGHSRSMRSGGSRNGSGGGLSNIRLKIVTGHTLIYEKKYKWWYRF